MDVSPPVSLASIPRMAPAGAGVGPTQRARRAAHFWLLLMGVRRTATAGTCGRFPRICALERGICRPQKERCFSYGGEESISLRKLNLEGTSSKFASLSLGHMGKQKTKAVTKNPGRGRDFCALNTLSSGDQLQASRLRAWLLWGLSNEGDRPVTDLISAKVPGVGSDVWSQFDSPLTLTFSHSQRKKEKERSF